VAAALVTVLLWASAFVAIRHVGRDVSPGVLALGTQLRAASWSTIGWVLYLGLLPTAVGFTTWAYALARSRAGTLAAMTYLVPPVATLLGWLVLAETPPAVALAGGALCLAGVYLTQRPERSD
jgi:drug/metabolite transporter (DMT)-like permease